LFEQGLAVRGIFYLLVAVIGAVRGSDFGGAVEQANGTGEATKVRARPKACGGTE
jgi:hypothetical protein